MSNNLGLGIEWNKGERFDIENEFPKWKLWDSFVMSRLMFKDGNRIQDKKGLVMGLASA